MRLRWSDVEITRNRAIKMVIVIKEPAESKREFKYKVVFDGLVGCMIMRNKSIELFRAKHGGWYPVGEFNSDDIYSIKWGAILIK